MKSNEDFSQKPDEETIEEFCSNLKVLRSSAGLTQEELAKRVGVSRQTITSIENGKMQPSTTLFLALVGLFLIGASLYPILKAIVNELNLSSVFEKMLKKG